MHEFDDHSLDVLEYPKIISILRGLCLTHFGMRLVDQTSPMTDAEKIRNQLDEIVEMKDIIRFGSAFPLYRLDDISGLFERSKTEGIFLEPLEILNIKEFIDIVRALRDYAPEEREKFPLIANYLKQLNSFPELSKEIGKTIDHDGTIHDNASAKLKKIRMDIADTKRKISRKLNQILSGRTKQPGWQDDTITQRDGRYVIPYLSGQFHQDSGIVHDRSQSGATLFVEPNETVEYNNKLGQNFQQERLEIDRILRALTAKIAEQADKLLTNCDLIGHLDFIHAAGNLAIKTGGEKPDVSGKARFNLIEARHPLLMYYVEDKKEIVANDISLDDGRLALVITGPNTGGKTVALKMVGLLIVMAQSGLHIPADYKSEIGTFKNIFADIGDEQSIELSLSTFSSHIRQIIYAVKHAGPNSLVLLDEIGAGTDPKEGSSLAEAILLKLIRNKVKVIATTHYSQLKTLPMLHAEIENASFEFDRESLRPTFRLQTGIPGASYAVEIASRLGMPQDITDNAADLVGTGERSLTKLIESLEKELATLREDKAALEDKLIKAGQLEEFYISQSNKLENEIEATKKEQLDEIQQTLYETRFEAERIVKKIKEKNASKDSVKQAHKFLKEKENLLNKFRAKQKSKTESNIKFETRDTVKVISLDSEGEIIDLIGNNRARVNLGNMVSTVELSDLEKISGAADKTKGVRRTVGLNEHDIPGPEVHLRGLTVDEATEKIDKYLDSAVVSGLTQIYVIHGKGTGTLRKVISGYLKKHLAVKSFRLGDWNEGGAGVTVVQLK